MDAQPGLTMHNYKQDALFAAIVVGFATSSLSTGFRFLARRRTVKVWRRDDWFMFVGLVWSWAVIAAILHSLTVGLGEETLTTDHDKLWLPRTNAAMLMFQNWGVFCVKASILFFNMSLFKGRISTKLAWTVFAITLINSFTGFFIAFLQEIAACPRADKRCFGESKFVVPLTTGIISTLCDIVIYVMPIPILTRLGVDRRTKCGLCCVFLLGLLCIATSFARWAAMLQNHPKDDVAMPSSIGISLWTFVELSAGITCGNLPILAPMFGCVGSQRGRGTGQSTPHLASNFKIPFRPSQQALNRPVKQQFHCNAGNNPEHICSSPPKTETPSPLHLSLSGSDIELTVLSVAAASGASKIPVDPPQPLTRDSSQRLSVLERRKGRAGFESLE